MLRISNLLTAKSLMAAWGMVACGLLAGCGDPGIGAIPVQGTILVDGTPTEGAMVIFTPESAGGRAASGRTDAQGVYKLTTEVNEDGALAGKYQVSVTKHVNEQDDLPKDVDPNDPESLDAVYQKVDARKKQVSKNFISRQYENPKGSGLIAEVEDGKENNFKFEVSAN